MTDFKGYLDIDLSNTFFNTSEFAEAVTYVMASGVTVTPTIPGIFDSKYAELITQENTVIQSRELMVQFSEVNLPVGAGPGDVCIIRTKSYKVLTLQPDGVGTVVLTLRKVS